MNQVVCDECERPIPTNAPTAFRLVRVFDGLGEVGDPRDADFCCVACLRQWLEHEYPARRPDFDAAWERLESAGVDQLEAAIDNGELDGLEVVEEVDGVPAVVHSRVTLPRSVPNHGLGGSAAIAKIREHQAKAAN